MVQRLVWESAEREPQGRRAAQAELGAARPGAVRGAAPFGRPPEFSAPRTQFSVFIPPAPAGPRLLLPPFPCSRLLLSPTFFPSPPDFSLPWK